MEKLRAIFSMGLLMVALVVTLGSLSVTSADAAAAQVECKEDPGDQCKLSGGDILHGWDEVDREIEVQ